MHRDLLPLLACPSCRVGYELVSHADYEDRVLSGYLRCPSCAIVIPIIERFVLFTEPLPHAGLASAEALHARAVVLFGSAERFDDYRREKLARDLVEPYAAFHPFNESTRVLAPLLPHVTPLLQPGDAVLDLWARTGWSGEWLAGLLPAQRIVSVWEGDGSVMGYRGYRHLLGAGQGPRNLDVIFTHPERPLPFRDGAFPLLYSLDSLHRYPLYPFASESLRVTRRDGAVIHAHLHLSNSEPEPFFERGCNQWHGRDWRAWLDAISDDTRPGYLFSEASLFNGPATAVLADDCDSTHYNGLLALLPPTTPAAPAQPDGGWRYALNFMFRLNLGRHSAKVVPALHGAAVDHLLLRHPVYAARLPEGARRLDAAALLALLLSATGATHDAQLAAVDGDAARAELATALAALCADELLFAAPITADGHALQRFHANQYAPQTPAASVAGLWPALRAVEQALLVFDDGTALHGADLAELALRIAPLLRTRGLVAGDWLAIDAGSEPMLWLAAIAAAAAGVNVSVAPERSTQPFRFRICGDATPVPGALPLGLADSGADETLLGALAALDAETGAEAGIVPGSIEFCFGAGVARCGMLELVDALTGLHAQLEAQNWTLTGAADLSDLLAVLLALLRGERLHFPSPAS